MGISVTDNALHFGGGALLALPIAAFHDPIATGVVFLLWGLLREQSQKNIRGNTFQENWFDIWGKSNLIEALTWGLGGFAAHFLWQTFL